MANTATKIPLEPVESGTIHAIGYDGAKQIVAVQFKTGHIYYYAGVSPDAAITFYTSPSKGRHYAADIKGKYSGQKMTGACAACGAIGWIGETCAACGNGEHVEAPRPLLHACTSPETGRTQRADCGQRVPDKQIARSLEAITCDTCKAVLDARERMEV